MRWTQTVKTPEEVVNACYVCSIEGAPKMQWVVSIIFYEYMMYYTAWIRVVWSSWGHIWIVSSQSHRLAVAKVLWCMSGMFTCICDGYSLRGLICDFGSRHFEWVNWCCCYLVWIPLVEQISELDKLPKPILICCQVLPTATWTFAKIMK